MVIVLAYFDVNQLYERARNWDGGWNEHGRERAGRGRKYEREKLEENANKPNVKTNGGSQKRDIMQVKWNVDGMICLNGTERWRQEEGEKEMKWVRRMMVTRKRNEKSHARMLLWTDVNVCTNWNIEIKRETEPNAIHVNWTEPVCGENQATGREQQLQRWKSLGIECESKSARVEMRKFTRKKCRYARTPATSPPTICNYFIFCRFCSHKM